MENIPVNKWNWQTRWTLLWPGTLTVLLFCISFFLLTLVFIPQWFSLHPLGKSAHAIVSVSIDFPTNSKWDAPFHCIAYYYFCADWDSLHDHFRDVQWEDIFRLSTFAATSEFCDWVKIGIDLYSLTKSIRSNVTHLHDFQQFVLLP